MCNYNINSSGVIAGCLVIFLFFSACGYHTAPHENGTGERTISIAYVQGDATGEFTDELIRAVASNTSFRYVTAGGDVELNVTIFPFGSDKIGYRYNRSGINADITKDLIAVENRLRLMADVVVRDPSTKKDLWGPHKVTTFVDFDYNDGGSISELSFMDPQNRRRTAISFSLGQLDSIEGAQIDASLLVYKKMAQKIADGLHLFVKEADL